MTRPGNYVKKAPKLSLGDVLFTQHALDRALDMAVDGFELRTVIESPDFAYVSRKHEAWVFEAGRVAVGLRPSRENPDVWAVLTVLWSTAEAWELDASMGPLPHGREDRPDRFVGTH